MSTSSPATAQSVDTSYNPLGVRVIDHVEFYVDDLEKWVSWHEDRLGLYRRAEGDVKSGLLGKKSIVVGQGRVNFVFSVAQGDSTEANEIRKYIETHGCGVRDVAFRVACVETAMKHATGKGIEAVGPILEAPGFNRHGIKAYGDTIHSFVSREKKCRTFLPGYSPLPGGVEIEDIHFMMIDHIVANVEVMDEWVDYYATVFGFDTKGQFDIKTGRSALMSKVVGNEDGYIRLPINEPSSDNSQIQEYLDEFKGPGVQHIALLTSNIVTTVNSMRGEGVDFLEVPDTYYEALPARVGEIKEKISDLQSSKVLVDRDREDGYLLQLFSKPIFDRPTLFYEIIQRHGNSVGFGEGNFQALFEAIEREQERRGSL